MATTHASINLGKTRTLTTGKARLRDTKRSRFVIIANILRQSQFPTKKTHIMYDCNLSFDQLNRYLQFMRKQALLQKQEHAQIVTYQTTTKGTLFLKRFEAITRLLQS